MPPLAAVFVRAYSGMFSAVPDWGCFGPRCKVLLHMNVCSALPAKAAL
jgi:hypothetical protein